MKDKEAIVRDMELKFDAQSKSNSATVNRLILVTADLQAQLKESKQTELENIRACEDARGRVASLQALTDELKVQLSGSMDRERDAKAQLADQAVRARQEMATKEARFAERESALNKQLASVQDAETRTAELNIMLETDKRGLQAEVKKLEKDNKEVSDELAEALEIAKTFEKSLKQELSVVDFWNNEVKNVAQSVLGPETAKNIALEDQLARVGAAYQEKDAALQQSQKELAEVTGKYDKMKELEMKEHRMLEMEHKRARELAKQLVDEEHREFTLYDMLVKAQIKTKLMREALIRNDSRHKLKEAELENNLVDLRESQRVEKLEMNETLERTRVKVEEAKKLAENAQNLSKMMRLYDDDKVLASRGLLR